MLVVLLVLVMEIVFLKGCGNSYKITKVLTFSVGYVNSCKITQD